MKRTSAFGLVVVTALGGCPADPVLPLDHDRDAAGLEAFELSLRPAVRARLLAGTRADHGADPVALAANDDGVFVLLQGLDRLQVIGGPKAATAPFPSALVSEGGDVVVVGSLVRGPLQRFRVVHAVPLIAGVGEGAPSVHLQELPRTGPAFDGVSALAAGRGLLDVGTVDGDVVTLRGAQEMGRCAAGGLGLTSLQRLPHHVVALSSLAHALVVFPLDDDGVPVCALASREDFNGLLFTMIASEDEGGVDVVVSGIEDAPLDRAGGSFGHIDSFLFGVRFEAFGPTRVWETNLSEPGVVNGKAMVREGDDDADALVVWGTGSGRFAVVDVDSGAVSSTGPAMFGVQSAIVVDGQRVVASTLEDTVQIGDARIDLGGPASALELQGERMVFTTAMGPQQRSTGELSRFTCESCHVGGGVDGRVHDTARRDDEGRPVTATTKPLWGLFENPPLFTRAMDRSVAVMVHAEFKVANANSPQDPWFSVDDDDVPVDPLALRRSMIAFFASFDPPPNARAYGRGSLDDDEALGLLHFTRRCSSCHEARVFADVEEAADADTGAPRLDVVAGLLRGALVFGRSGHEDTGVRPKVHPAGARPSSLRAIGRKTPLLTSGRARDLAQLLEQARVDVDGRFLHEGQTGQPLSSSERRSLLRFLRLL
ncbi:MAG: hypothetical protein Q8O67_34320 [Deltaproteobacteria bacterium]|nr:hypothetical protein [Deltaproteobacteria bacterium]